MVQEEINKFNQEIEKIELRSNEVQEVLSRPPKWIIRWGITVVFIVVAIIIIGSWVFKYPDIISAPIVLTTENPPAQIVSKVSGNIQNLFVVDNEIVKKNQVIGVIENSGDYSSVKKLEDHMQEFQQNFIPGEIYLIKDDLMLLGEIQSYYASFSKYIDEYNEMIKLDYHQRKIDLYNTELKRFMHYLENLKQQDKILHEELDISKKQFNRDSVLYVEQLMSEAEFEKSKSVLLSKKYNLEQNNLSKTNTEIQVEGLNQSILELELQKEKQLSNQVLYIKEKYENLISAIDTWKYTYVLIAQTDGVVTFNQFWNENQTVKLGETVLTIIPEDEGEVIGKVQLTFQGAGKVKVGQSSNIQFANYPYMEFGMVQGVVNSISLVPENNYYTAEIKLPNGLKTFYNIDLDFKQEMQGTIEIITEDIRLLERIIRPLRFIWNKNTKFGDLKK